MTEMQEIERIIALDVIRVSDLIGGKSQAGGVICSLRRFIYTFGTGL